MGIKFGFGYVLLELVYVIVLIAEWNLPPLVGGLCLRSILCSQCAALYRGWRYRLKERYYVGYSITKARRNKPGSIDITKWEWLVDRISDKNKRNKLKQTVLHSNGEKSTVRILEELMNTPQGEVQQSQQREGLDGTSLEADSEQQGDPLYRLGSRTKTTKKTRGNSDEVRAEIEQLQQVVAKKECALRAVIERVKQECSERENKLRQESIDRENRLKQESIEREKKMRADLMAELMSMMQSST
ncbi:Stress response protein nst1 [Bienertia sinuspersici]